MGLYYDDFKEGDEWTTSSRTITEADVVNFACLTGDFNPLHTDEEWCKAHSPFKRRIAHGLLTLSYATGLAYRLGLTHDTTVAFLGSQFRFPAPVIPGDTISVKQKVLEKKESKKDDRGVVVFSVCAFNQRGEMVLDATHTIMLQRKPQG